MKRLILCSILAFGLSGWVNAQTDQGTSSTRSSETKQSSKKEKVTKKKAVKKNKRAAKKSAKLNNRKIYHWKNGQRATPTGHEATGTNGGYSAIGRDTTRKKKQ